MSNDPFGSPPLNSGHFSENPYQTPGFQPGQPGLTSGRRGLVNHIRIVAILNGVQAIMELLMGGMLVFMGTIFTTMKNEMIEEMQRGQPGPEAPDPAFMHTIMVGVMAGLGAMVLLAALFRIWATISNFRLKGRWLGVISLICGLASGLTMYCAPTGIAVAVYGLVVLLSSEVGEAFEMRKTAESADDVLRHFNARPV